MANFDKNKKHASWIVNSFCNFSCPYCMISLADRKNPNLSGNPNIDAVVDFFDKRGSWHINMTGGEPFLHPRFIEFCQKITKNHVISMNTNLSSPKVYEFIEKINPERVVNIVCSLQITELERLNLKEEYIKKVQKLKTAGFNFTCTLVMWPPIIERLPEIFEEFQNQGIKVAPSVFYGVFGGKTFPGGYSKKQLDLLKKFSGQIKEKDPNIHSEPLSFKNQTCLAGFSHIIISEEGDIFRCHSDRMLLGNIYKDENNLFKEPMPCRKDFSQCPWECHLFAKPTLGQKLNIIKEKINALSTK